MKTLVWYLVLWSGLPLVAQQGDLGFAVPLTITVGAMHTHRLQSEDPDAGPVAAAFRTMWYPALKLGPHWFAAASIQVNSSPFFYFTSYESEREIQTKVIQGYVGYTRSRGRNSLTVKAGQLISAFGSFPLRYDDEVNPLIDAPLGYGSSEYGPLDYPVTLYGQPGVEVDANLRRLDARLQFVNSSPANPRALFAGGQKPNWVAGAGYTIRQGFRVGGSFYRGGYLTVGRFLRPSENASDWPATGLGWEVQWSRGHWSINGEWQRFYFPYPRFLVNPTLRFGTAEVKRTIHPRLYLATRAGYSTYSSIQTVNMPSPVVFRRNRQSYELVAGFRVNRSQLLKIGYEWLHTEGVPGARDNVFGVQFVTTLQPLSKVFHENASRRTARLFGTAVAAGSLPSISSDTHP